MNRSSRRYALCALAIAVVLGACGGTPSTGDLGTTSVVSGSTSSTGATGTTGSEVVSTTSAESPHVEIAWNADDFIIPDIPMIMAMDVLTDRGWTFNVTFVAEPEQAVQAVARGQANFGQFNPLIIMAAAEQEEPVAALFDWKRHSWTLVAQPDIASIDDLEGRSLAVHSETSFTNTVAEILIEENGLQDVEIIIMPGSPVRAQAMAQGQLDSTLLLLDEMIFIEHELGYEFNILESLADRFPEFPTGHNAVNTEWAQANEDVVVEFTKELILATDVVIDEPEVAIEAAMEHFDDIDPVVVRGIIESFNENGLFVRDGGITEESALGELEFYFESGETTLEPTPENVSRVYALPFLETTRQELGR